MASCTLVVPTVFTTTPRALTVTSLGTTPMRQVMLLPSRADPLVLPMATLIGTYQLFDTYPGCVPTHVVASVPLVVQSPERLSFVIDVVPEKRVRLPLAGEPVVVTVPAPPPTFPACVK